MTTSLDHLLPAPEQTMRCAEHAREIGIDPGGTAIRADRVVLVEAPLPWPKPALDHPVVRPLATILAGGPRPVRVLATVPAVQSQLTDPSDGNGVGPSDGTTITVYERNGGSAVERTYRTPSAEASVELAQALADDDLERAAAYQVGHYDRARPAVLICTQGSHDVCCGSDGTRLATEVDAFAAIYGGHLLSRVFRVSHTGGHRFAPTAMTLPDGRMWAYLSLADLTAILERSADPGAAAEACRGWWGAAEGPAQVAERAVLAERGWSLDEADRQVDVAAPAEAPGSGAGSGAGRTEGRMAVTVTVSATADTEAESWAVEVAPGRTVPTIACRAPGGLPAKPAQEYQVLSVSRTG